MFKKLATLLAGVALMMGVGNAYALTLTVNDGSGAISWDSGTSGVSAGVSTSNFFSYNDAFTFTISGLTEYGSNYSYQDQSSLNIKYTGNGPAKLTVTLSDISYILNTLSVTPNTTATMTAHVNKLKNAAISFSGYYDNSNVLNNTANLIGTISPIAPSYTDYELTKNITTANPFSLTEVVTIDFAGTGSLVSLDATLDVAPVPEPGTMVLLGAGMLGLAIFGKRRMNREA
jgi:hypothetical protein